MSLFKSIFDKLLGNKPAQDTHTPAPALSRWEIERQENIRKAETAIKGWLTEKVKEKGTLNFSWESGNDEAFLEFEEYNDAEQDQYETLEMYIVDSLEIPDAGPFQMTGNGTLYIADNVMKVMHSSILREIVDYDEKTEEEIFGNTDEEKGDVALFTI